MGSGDPDDGSNLRADQTQAQAVLESAKNRLNVTQQAYLASQDNYIKANALLVEQQNKLADISAKLTRLASHNVKLVS